MELKSENGAAGFRAAGCKTTAGGLNTSAKPNHRFERSPNPESRMVPKGYGTPELMATQRIHCNSQYPIRVIAASEYSQHGIWLLLGILDAYSFEDGGRSDVACGGSKFGVHCGSPHKKLLSMLEPETLNPKS